jgi:hypothetical protein
MPVTVVVEDPFAVVAAGEDVVDPAFELDSRSSWHAPMRLGGANLAPPAQQTCLARLLRGGSLGGVTDGCDTGVCGADVPPLVGSVLTGTGLTLDQAVAALERGESPPLTDVQRRIVEEHAAARL